jgi:hypothetical protein
MNKIDSSKLNIWKKRIAEWKESGINQSSFCKKHGIKLSTFYYWKKRLSKKIDNRFVKLPVNEYKAEPWKLIIPGGVRIIFERVVKLETIIAVLEAICLSIGKR